MRKGENLQSDPPRRRYPGYPTVKVARMCRAAVRVTTPEPGLVRIYDHSAESRVKSRLSYFWRVETDPLPDTRSFNDTILEI